MKNFKQNLHYLKFTYLSRARHDLKIALNPQPEPIVKFLGCGAQKSGTTALDRYLRQHPEISLPDKKEIHFFDIEYNFRYPRIDYAKYHSFFDLEPRHKIAGEVTPAYMYWEHAPRRIWQYNPEMKIILLLRNPIHRAFSQWNMNREKELETLSFRKAIENENDRMKTSLPYQNKQFSYIDRGRYAHQIRRLYRYFDKDQVLVLKSSALEENTQQTMDTVFRFLGLSSPKLEIKKQIHRGNYHQELAASDVSFLKDLFYFEIKNLENLLDWDCSEWLE